MIADIQPPEVSSGHKYSYQRLKLALSLGLRRQIFLAVCDDLSLRNRLAGRLQFELGTSKSGSDRPKLVSLGLNLSDPNPLGQMAQWMAQNQAKRGYIPSFQILGVELLTQRSPTIQRSFLKRLQTLAQNLPRLETSLLLWVPRPWLNTIQQSVPEFWQWHTGLFEFEGEPTPIPPTNSVDELLLESTLVEETQSVSVVEDPAISRSSEIEEAPEDPEKLIQSYLNLGNHYRDRIAQGDVTLDNLGMAIQAYEEVLQRLNEFDPQIPDLLNDLGNLYWMRSRHATSGDQTLYLQEAIFAYQLALTKLTDSSAPQTYAMIQNNLGAAYGDLARYREPAESLQLSIGAYEEALRFRSVETEPLKYASTQNNLGTAYWHLAQHQTPVVHLKSAIAAYVRALVQYDPEQEALNWAMIQNNLGTAYWNLAQYEQPTVWLQLAINAYQDALIYRTPEATPAACAASLNNLGTAYWHLADRSQDNVQLRREYLVNAIAAYENTLSLATQTPPIPVNFDLAATHNNLGLAHFQLATVAQFALDKTARYTHLESALQQHLQAMQRYSQNSDGYQSALTYVIKTIRAFYKEGGISGQNLAMSKVPGQLLPVILPRL